MGPGHITSAYDGRRRIDIVSFSLPAAPQSSHQFDRAASDLLSEQTRLNILFWNPGTERCSPGTIEGHIAGR